jgi:hypothetical protein
VLLIVGLGFAGSVGTLLRTVPGSVLGAILFFAGAQMALGSCDFSRDKAERFATLCTAAFAVWNVGIAFLVGLGLRWLLARGYVRL